MRECAADGAESLDLVHASDALNLAQVLTDVHLGNDDALGLGTGLADLLFGDGPDGIELEHSDLLSFLPELVDCREGAAADGTVGDDNGLGVVEVEALDGGDVVYVVEDLGAVAPDGR